ncbi:hypothetical protein R5W23_004834 [Gemmata sp. JC673]|uniref:Uncharacterized protein n=1 Tax=Gemmata algarum TaxID=2975278 RepID=A0ABU5F890_9BACT|nr:hypothetical protein [Gemmata algarum]MDY3563333.1 hypothetical protein [Gemmata algarum]
MTGSDRTRQRRKSTALAVILGASVVGLCALCPISNGLLLRPLLAAFDSRYVPGQIEPMPFDRDLWRAGNGRHRVGMARYLSDKKLLDGKSRAELVEMLGEPDVDQPRDEGVRWLLGFYAKGLFDETLWLELTLGEKGTASGAIVSVSWDDPRRR